MYEQTTYPARKNISGFETDSLLEILYDPMLYFILYNIIFALYLVISLSTYEYRIRRAKPVRICQRFRITAAGFNSLPRIFCWLASIILLIFWSFNLLVDEILVKKMDICDWSMKLRNAFAMTLRFFLMLTLWSRQRFLYRNKAIKQLTTTLGRVLSIVVGIIGAMVMLGPLPVFTFFVDFKRMDGVCVFVSGRYLYYFMFRYLRIFIVAVYFALTLLFLLPLLKHNSRQAQNNSQNGESTRGNMKNLVIRSCTVCTIHSMATLGAFAISSFQNPRVGLLIITHTSATIPMLLNVFIFKDWRARLMPWKTNFLLGEREGNIQTSRADVAQTTRFNSREQ